MRKLTQRLLMLLTLAVLVFAVALTTPDPVPVVEAGGDCDAIGRVCRQMSEGIYNLCIELGGGASECAWNEANNTLNCLQAAGCPLHN